ncbi:MAG: DMT family transporter [Myxococcaceae bacterium]
MVPLPAARRPSGPLLILAAAALWSTAGAAIKLCTLNAWQISLGRSLVAAVVLWLFLPGARGRPSRRTWAVASAYAVTVVLFTVANKLTTSANAIFLQDTAPLYVLLLSPLLLGERPSRSELWSVPLFLLGLALFFKDRLTPGQLSGNLVALASGVSFAFLILGLRGLSGGNAPALVLGNLLATAASLPGALGGPSVNATDLGIVLFLGVFQLGLSYALFARGLRHTPATEASLLALLEPVLNPVWTFLLAHERPGPWALAGGSLVLLGTLWRTLAPWAEARLSASQKRARV